MANHRFPLLARLVLGAGMALALAGAAAAAEPAPRARPVGPVVLSDAEQALAARVAIGNLPCELGQTVSMRADPELPGHFHLQLKDQRFHLRPVESATGALRLEDQGRGAVWIQLANKSMLMDQRHGKRLADECAGALQQAYAAQLKLNPAPSLLDVTQKSR
ncbi:MAG: hypothetical protein RJA36_1836 [Pseudomonadota bacterium]|jgi:hypothetical protein